MKSTQSQANVLEHSQKTSSCHCLLQKTSFSPDEIYKSIWVRMNFDRHYLLIFLLYSCVDGLSGLLPPPPSLSLSLSLSSRFLSSSSSLSWVKTASTSRAQSGSALRRTEPMLGSRRSRAHTVQTSCRGNPGFWTLFSASPTDLWLPPDSLPEQWSHMSGNHPSNCKSSISNTKKSLLISDLSHASLCFNIFKTSMVHYCCFLITHFHFI